MPASDALWCGYTLSTRASNTLLNADIRSVSELKALGRAYLRRIPNCGDQTADEIITTVFGSKNARH
jgi:DNA-directed RNA polymerase alpha subunit